MRPDPEAVIVRLDTGHRFDTGEGLRAVLRNIAGDITTLEISGSSFGVGAAAALGQWLTEQPRLCVGPHQFHSQ